MHHAEPHNAVQSISRRQSSVNLRMSHCHSGLSGIRLEGRLVCPITERLSSGMKLINPL